MNIGEKNRRNQSLTSARCIKPSLIYRDVTIRNGFGSDWSSATHSVDWGQVPGELASFKFARQKSKLAGTIRGSYFVIKGEY